MKLTLQSPFMSIKAFPTVSLPALTVVVGINGSGKSQLLQAIQALNISNSLTNDQAQIRLINTVMAAQQPPMQQSYHSQIPYAGGLAGPPGMPGAMPGGIAYPTGIPGGDNLSISAFRESLLDPFYRQINALVGGTLPNIGLFPRELWRLTPSEIQEVLIKNAIPAPPIDQLQEIYRLAEQHLENAASRGPFPHAAPPGLPQPFANFPAVAKKLGKSLLQLTDTDMSRFRAWGQSDLFTANMGLVFGRYRDTWLENQLVALSDRTNGTAEALSAEEFIANFGPAPWDTVNATLRDFSLPYEISKPDLHRYEPVNLTLRRTDNSETVAIEALSSGEKVLLSFLMATFVYDETRVTVARPKLLLLDELDASLHPEMVARWLKAMSTGIVEKQGITVVLTTHSPTTAALAPDESLHEMTGGTGGLVRVDKQTALNKLTYGLPTIAIDISGRRQVYVESNADAIIYDSCYKYVRGRLDSERSLTFLATGLKTKQGEINSGCDLVKKIVTDLHNAGNISVFGLIDWDGVNSSTERVVVLAEGLKDGLENVFLEPLLVAILLIKKGIGLESFPVSTFTGLSAASGADLQNISDHVSEELLLKLGREPGNRTVTNYLGGASVLVDSHLLTTDDHTLESAIFDAFPPLRQFDRGRGKLVQAVIDEVIREYPDFCPVDVVTAFRTLADDEANKEIDQGH